MTPPASDEAVRVGENVGRLKSELRRHPGAMTALRSLGLGGATIDRLHLGLKSPYRERGRGLETRDALCFPVLGEGMVPVGRYGYLNIPDVTVNPHDPIGWGPGRPLVYRLGSFGRDAEAIVAADVVDAWLAWQQSRGQRPGSAFLSRSQPRDWPAEWASPEWWAGFSRVVLLPGRGAEDFIAEAAPRIGRPLEIVNLPAPFEGMADLTTGRDAPSFDAVIEAASGWTPAVPVAVGTVPTDRLGRFAARPVSVAGAWTGGHLYHPFLVEVRGVERAGAIGEGRVVHSWQTMVLRSDGLVLTAEELPAPRGTPASGRVMALSDGTRIVAPPAAARAGTWSFASIDRFVEWRRRGGTAPFRVFGKLLEDVEAFLRGRVWLPLDEQYVVVALYVALSHVYQVFEAIPLLLVQGPRGTGKSELGDAIARLSFNGVVAGQLRTAGMIRLLDETRGLLVLDDMDGDGAASVVGTGDLAQTLKTSYKRSTSRKPIADRGGRVRMVDFFGPKVLTSCRGVDEVLGSRMFAIATAAAPDLRERAIPPGEEELDALRDELHCWAMAEAGEVAAAFSAIGHRHGDRRAEISRPLLALAALAGSGIAVRLDVALSNPCSTPVPRA